MNAQEHATTGYSPPQKLRRSSRPAEQAQQQVDDLADQYRSAALEISNLPEYLQQAKGTLSAVLNHFVHLPAGGTSARTTKLGELTRTVEKLRAAARQGGRRGTVEMDSAQLAHFTQNASGAYRPPAIVSPDIDWESLDKLSFLQTEPEEEDAQVTPPATKTYSQAAYRGWKSRAEKAESDLEAVHVGELADALQRWAELRVANDRLSADMAVIDDERAQLYERLAWDSVAEECGEAVATQRMEVVEHKLEQLKTFEGGKFTPALRAIYMRFLAANVASHNLNALFADIMQCVGVDLEGKLPSDRSINRMQVERGQMAALQAVRKLSAVPDGRAGIHHDEARKYVRARLAVGFSSEIDGVGSLRTNCTLGVMDMAGGTAVHESGAVLKRLRWLARVQTEADAAAGKDTVTTVESLLRKFGAANTDSAATAQAAQRLLFEKVVAATLPPEATKEERDALMKELLHEFCWLHKDVGLAKAMV